MKWYVVPVSYFKNKKNWDSSSGFVNSNPVLLNAQYYGIPEDFLSEEVVAGSRENNLMRSRIEKYILENKTDLPPIIPNGTNPWPPPDILTHWPTGSVGKSTTDGIRDRIRGKIKDIACPLFSSMDHINNVYVRNSEFWGIDIVQEFTGISPFNSYLQNRGAGVPITKRHIVTCAHYALPGTPDIGFVTADGQFVKRKILKGKNHPNYNPAVTRTWYPDLTIYTLDEDLPDSIKIYKLLPTDYGDHFPLGVSLGIGTNQLKKALVFESYDLNFIQTGWARFRYGSHLNYRTFFENPVGGDSSSPYFFIINNELVLVGCTTGSACTFLTGLIPDINQLIIDCDALAGVSTGYTVSTITL